MNKESLIKTKSQIINLLFNLDIDDVDRVELMVNLRHFLDADKYEENIKTLIKKKEGKKCIFYMGE